MRSGFKIHSQSVGYNPDLIDKPERTDSLPTLSHGLRKVEQLFSIVISQEITNLVLSVAIIGHQTPLFVSVHSFIVAIRTKIMI